MSEQETLVSPIAEEDINEENREQERTSIAVHESDIEVS